MSSSNKHCRNKMEKVTESSSRVRDHDNGISICIRLVHTYNQTHEEKIKICENTSHSELRKITDRVLNKTTLQNIPDSIRRDWMNDKFEYIGWARDELVSSFSETY